MQILATGTAFPPHYYLQDTILAGLKTQLPDRRETVAMVERLHHRTGVDGRYFSLPLEQYPALDTFGKTNDVWIQTAAQLGEQAIDCVLKRAGLDRQQIDALFFVTVTGLSAPSADALIVNRMGLAPRIK